MLNSTQVVSKVHEMINNAKKQPRSQQTHAPINIEKDLLKHCSFVKNDDFPFSVSVCGGVYYSYIVVEVRQRRQDRVRKSRDSK